MYLLLSTKERLLCRAGNCMLTSRDSQYFCWPTPDDFIQHEQTHHTLVGRVMLEIIHFMFCHFILYFLNNITNLALFISGMFMFLGIPVYIPYLVFPLTCFVKEKDWHTVLAVGLSVLQVVDVDMYLRLREASIHPSPHRSGTPHGGGGGQRSLTVGVPPPGRHCVTALSRVTVTRGRCVCLHVI